MNAESVVGKISRLRRSFVSVVIVVSVVPLLLSLAGLRVPLGAEQGPLLYLVLEWTAFLTGVGALVMAVLHFSIRGDVSVAIIGVTLFAAGLVDGLTALSENGLAWAPADPDCFVMFAWMMGRTFTAAVFLLGAGIFIVGGWGETASARRKGLGFVLTLSVVMVAGAFLSVYLATKDPDLPGTLHAGGTLAAPWMYLPLVLFIVAGAYVIPMFHKWHGSHFSRALLLSMVPHVASVLYMVAGSRELYDGHFFAACGLKVFALLVPLHGLRDDYKETYLREAQERAELADERLVEEQQSASHAKDRHLLDIFMEHARDPIYVKDISLRYVEMNEACARRLGLKDPLDCLGKKAAAFLPPHTAEEEEQGERKAISSGKPVDGVYPLRGAHKKVIGVVGFPPPSEG